MSKLPLFAFALSFVVLSPLTAQADTTQDIAKAQVLLDRAHFSPGVIDGQSGSNMRKAVGAYQEAHGMTKTDAVDATLLAALEKADTSEVLVPTRSPLMT
jgi:peptidoglycan hydrolase-like protein with peptidoglycan-binding domain